MGIVNVDAAHRVLSCAHDSHSTLKFEGMFGMESRR